MGLSESPGATEDKESPLSPASFLGHFAGLFPYNIELPFVQKWDQQVLCTELLDEADHSHVPSFYTDPLSDPQIVPSAGPRPHSRLGLPGRSPAPFQPVSDQGPPRPVGDPWGPKHMFTGLLRSWRVPIPYVIYIVCACHICVRVCRSCMWRVAHVNKDLSMCPAHGGARDAAEIPHVPSGPQFSLKPDACLEASLTHRVSQRRLEGVTPEQKAEACWVGVGASLPHSAAVLHSIGPRLQSQRRDTATAEPGVPSPRTQSLFPRTRLSRVVGQMDEITGLSGYKLSGNGLTAPSP